MRTGAVRHTIRAGRAGFVVGVVDIEGALGRDRAERYCRSPGVVRRQAMQRQIDATTAKPCAASVADTASAWLRLPVMPCWKITTGQPVAGLVWPEAAFGIVASTGIVTSLVFTGNGLAKVRLVERGSSPAASNGGT